MKCIASSYKIIRKKVSKKQGIKLKNLAIFRIFDSNL